MSGWRALNDDEVIIELSRWEIEAMTWDAYHDLCEFPNRVVHDTAVTDFVQWIIPVDQLTWLMLKYPELAEGRRHRHNTELPYIPFPGGSDETH